MKRLPSVFLSAGLLALAACSDPSAPTAEGIGGLPRLNAAGDPSNGELERVSTARSNAVEPRHWDHARFNIELKFLIAPTAAQRAAFEVAAARWERTIIADVPSISGTLPSCFGGVPPVSTSGVDDIIIEVVLQNIDGPGRILGSAGPCYVRSADRLPVSGRMFFDTSDLPFLESLGLLDEVVVHEMGHVLGIGTLWNFGGRSLRRGTGAGVFFAGDYGNKHWQAEGGEGLLPIENMGGPGTAGGHWRESVLRNELMTGFLNLGVNPLSRITAGSLRDMGYGVGIVGEKYELARGAAGVGASVASEEGVDIDAGEIMLPVIGVVPTHLEP